MPANFVSINLLGESNFVRSPVGRIVNWAVTYGRYIMIGTEIIVLLAFISRFSLDRKLTDLKEEISQKQAILRANTQLESEIRAVQSTINLVKNSMVDQQKPLETLASIQSLLPPDVYLKTLSIGENKITADVTAGTADGFALFLQELVSNKKFINVQIGDVSKRQLTGIEFSITLGLSSDKNLKKLK